MTYKVFISHSHKPEDKGILSTVEKAIKECNCEPKIAEKEYSINCISIPDKILNSIESCDCIVGIITKNAISSKWVGYEIAFATKRLPILTLLEKNLNLEMNDPLRFYEFILLDYNQLETSLKRFKERLLEICKNKKTRIKKVPTEIEIKYLTELYLCELEKFELSNTEIKDDNLKLVKLIIRLPTLIDKPAIELYSIQTIEAINSNQLILNSDSKIKIDENKSNVSFAGCSFKNIKDSMLNAGVRYFDKVYAIIDTKQKENKFLEENKIIIEIMQKYESDFTCLPKTNFECSPYLVSSFELFNISKKLSYLDQYDINRLIGICYLLKAFAGTWMTHKEKPGKFRWENDLLRSWNFIIYAFRNIINNNNCDKKIKWHSVFHLLGAVEWLGYLYANSIFLTPKNKNGEFLSKILEKLIISTYVPLHIILEAIWTASWIGLATADKNIAIMLGKSLAHYNNREIATRCPIIISNLKDAFNRTTNEEYRKIFCSLIAVGQDGTINNFSENKVFKKHLKDIRNYLEHEDEIRNALHQITKTDEYKKGLK